MTDAQLKAWHSRFALDDRVRHYGTRQWGVVREVKPTNYGVELVVERIVDSWHSTSDRGYWEGARIDLHERDGKRVCW